MKRSYAMIKTLILLVVLAAAAVPASQYLRTRTTDIQAVESAVMPLEIPLTGGAPAQNIAAQVIPYQAKPWLQPPAQLGFRGDAVPYQAKMWLKPPVQKGFRGDTVPYQAKMWLASSVQQGFRGDAIPYQAKPWLELEADR